MAWDGTRGRVYGDARTGVGAEMGTERELPSSVTSIFFLFVVKKRELLRL